MSENGDDDKENEEEKEDVETKDSDKSEGEEKDDDNGALRNVDNASHADLCNFIVQRLEPAFNALQLRRDQLESVRSDWLKIPIEAHSFEPVIAMRHSMLEKIEQQDRLEENLDDQIKGIVEGHHGGAAVLAAVRLRWRGPFPSTKIS